MTPIAALLLSLAPALPVSPSDDPDITPLLEFSDAESVAGWSQVHDSVMGGVSSGRVSSTGDAARFEGRVRLENNGGFASFRLNGAFPEVDGHDGLRLRVRGDGQVYKLSLRCSGRWDAVSWQASFGTAKGEWTTVHVPFAELAPSWRGRLVGDAPPFDAGELRQIGIVIADKQVGDFALEVSAIDTWRASGADDPAPGSRAAVRARTSELAAVLDGGAGADDIRRALEGSERVLVVASPRILGPDASKQIGRFLAQDARVADRDMRVVHLMGAGAGRMSGRTLGRAQVDGLRDAWDLPAREWSVALVGKDGGVKARWSEPVAPSEVFARIDAMPMREREVVRRRGH